MPRISVLEEKLTIESHIEIGQPFDCSQSTGNIVKDGIERMHELDAR